jgi:hypothetical protein
MESPLHSLTKSQAAVVRIEPRALYTKMRQLRFVLPWRCGSSVPMFIAMKQFIQPHVQSVENISVYLKPGKGVILPP